MNAPETKRNIEGIQVLRAIAALLVVMHHARHSVPGSEGWPEFGAAGVDIFFVISGFVMALTTNGIYPNADWVQRVTESSVFMRKRLIRIVPLYWLALLWTSRREITQGQIDTNLVKDFAFIPHPNNSYPDMLWPSLIQGWTLNYEMFFYAIFAVSLIFGKWRTYVLGLVFFVLIAFGNWLAFDGFSAKGFNTLESLMYFYTNDVLLEFLYGVLLYKIFVQMPSPRIPRVVFFCLTAAGFLLLAFSANWLSSVGWREPARSISQGLPAAMIVWSSIHAFSNIRVRLLEILGEASYAIYLFHWASFGMVKPIAAALNNMVWQAGLVNILMIVHILVAIVCGVGIHILIEKPLLRCFQRLFGVGNAAPMAKS